MSTFYTAGPNASWPWDGVCEGIDDGRYYYHPEWPRRSTTIHKAASTTIPSLVERGEWLPMPSDGPEVDDGL